MTRGAVPVSGIVPALDVTAAIAEARRLDDRIRLLSCAIGDNLTKLTDLIALARDTEIHRTLGYTSWTSYLASALGHLDLALKAPARRELVATLADEGMSERAIAQATRVSQSTVHRDVAAAQDDRQVIHDESPVTPVTGLDGKSYTRPRPLGSRAGFPSADPRPRKRRPLPDAFSEAANYIARGAERIERLCADDRFSRNAGGLRRQLSDLIRARDALDRTIAKLGESTAQAEVVDAEVVDL